MQLLTGVKLPLQLINLGKLLIGDMKEMLVDPIDLNPISHINELIVAFYII
jgi:hypothetical protein